MKLIFDIDKDDIGAMLVFMKPKADEKKKVREWLDSHDEIEVPRDLFDKDEAGEAKMTMCLFALASIGLEIEKE